jgi:hypothetical protein
LLPKCCAFGVLAVSISDLALRNVFFIGVIGNNLFALGLILAFEFQLMQLPQNVPIWRVKYIGTASIWTLLIILQSGHALFTIKHCTRCLGTF